MRIRVVYAKGPQLKYIGHLDLYRAWERLIRRAALPIAYTQGFNPHPKINMSPALPLGMTSRCEIVDFWLEKNCEIQEIDFSLKKVAPPGITIINVEQIPDNFPALQTQISSVRYRITLDHQVPDLELRVNEILDAPVVIRQRRGKTYDLRCLIENCKVVENPDPYIQQVDVQLASRDSATGRPDEFLSELKIPVHLARIERLEFIEKNREATAQV